MEHSNMWTTFKQLLWPALSSNWCRNPRSPYSERTLTARCSIADMWPWCEQRKQLESSRLRNTLKPQQSAPVKLLMFSERKKAVCVCVLMPTTWKIWLWQLLSMRTMRHRQMTDTWWRYMNYKDARTNWIHIIQLHPWYEQLNWC